MHFTPSSCKIEIFHAPMQCYLLLVSSEISIYLYRICFKFYYPVLLAIPLHLHAEFSSCSGNP